MLPPVFLLYAVPSGPVHCVPAGCIMAGDFVVIGIDTWDRSAVHSFF